MSRTAGIVLCGGQSSRMGQPKAWLPIAGDLMLPRIVRILAEVVSPIVVVAAVGQELPPLPLDVICAHDPKPNRGPLQGLAVGLAALANHADAAYVSSCDVPFLRPAFIQRMIELLGDHMASVPRVGGYLHPLAAVYRLEVAATAEQLLACDRLQTTALFETVSTRFVAAEELIEFDPDLGSLRNLNTPAEYQAAIQDHCGAK